MTPQPPAQDAELIKAEWEARGFRGRSAVSKWDIAAFAAGVKQAQSKLAHAEEGIEVTRQGGMAWVARAESAERKLAQAMRVVRKLAIHNVTANPGVLHHYKCLACDGRWSGRPTMPEQHNGDCPAALDMDKGQG